uniref:Uncharacterized protein n=1 Tax=Trichuris muris TaxID=70415 RepID=A0A5S6R1S7_TRIMR
MGASCVKPSKSDSELDEADGGNTQHRTNRFSMSHLSVKRLKSTRRRQEQPQQFHTVAMLAQATHNAGNLATALMTHAMVAVPDAGHIQELIRRAKGADKTVSIKNQCLFIDYQFVCYVPPGMVT